MYESASEEAIVAFHARARPRDQGTRVMPSGRFKFALNRPTGSFVIGTPAEEMERAKISLIAKCLVLRAAACLQAMAWVPQMSTRLPQRQSWAIHRGRPS